jgi:hypothetical protein
LFDESDGGWTVKPELTFRRSMRGLLTWWWVIVGCTILVTLLASSLSSHGLVEHKASVRVHEQDTAVSYQLSGALAGAAQPYTPIRGVNDLTKSDFVDPQVADAAAKKLGDISGSQLIGGLGFTALTGTEVELTYSGGSSPIEAAHRLSAYVSALVANRRATQRKPLVAAAQRARAHPSDTSTLAAQQLQTAADGLDQQIYQSGSISSATSRTVPHSAVVLGGFFAGLILGILVALTLTRLDPRILRVGDLREAGLRSIEIDRNNGDTMETLRALTEVGGIDEAGGVIAVMTPAGADTPTASALAASYAMSGRQTRIISDAGSARSEDGGWVETEADEQTLQSLPRLRAALRSVKPGEVTIIDAPGLEAHSQALIASAVADVTVLVLRRGRSRWNQLETSLELLEEAVLAGRVRIAMESTGLLNRSSSAMLGRVTSPRTVRARSYS